MTKMFVSATLAAMILSSAAFAQTAAPVAPAAPAAPAAAAPAAPDAGMDKMAKSKECSAEADKQGLKGKARKKFRSKCKAGKM